MKTTYIVLAGGYLIPIFNSVEHRLSIEESLIKAERDEDPGMYDDSEFIKVSNEHIGETLTVVSDDFGETVAVFDRGGNELEFEETKPLSAEKWRYVNYTDQFVPENIRDKGVNTRLNLHHHFG